MSAAAYVPLIGAAVVAVSAIIARTTARDIATLGAMQKRVEFELGVLDQYAEALLNASLKVQHYTWFGGDLVDNVEVDEDVFQNNREIFESVTTALQSLKFYGGTLLPDERWAEVRATYEVVVDIFDRVVASVDDDVDNRGRAAWHKAVSAQPDPIVQSHKAVTDLRLTLVNSYPDHAPDSLAERLRSIWRPGT